MMKKTILLSLLFVLLLTLAACNGQEESPAEDVSEGYPAEEAPVEEAAEASTVEASPATETSAEESSEAPAEEPPVEMESGLAIVDSVVISQQDGNYVATIEGNLTDGCTQISGTSQSVDGSTINITVETQRPADMMCTQALVPYTEDVVIDTSGLAEGRYTVAANGVSANETVIVGEAESAPSDGAAADGSQILNTVWQWTSVVESDPAAQAVVPDPENYTVTLLRDDRASIKADCNQVQVTYTLEGSSLVFNMLGPSTLAFCGEDSLDSQFLSLLGSVSSWNLENDQLQMQTSSGAALSFADGGSAPGGVGIEPSQISLDTQGLPVSWQAVVVPLQAYDESMPPGPQGLPEHVEILFGVTDPADRQSTDPVMFIIPVDTYVAMYEANDNQSVANIIDGIAELTYALPEPVPTSGYPVLPTAPYSPAIGANDVAVQLGRAFVDDASASKNGYRFVGRWAQDANPVTNQNLYYTYQGFTNDGQYLVSFFYPVSTDQLTDDPANWTQEQWDTFYADPMVQISTTADALNQISSSDWDPDLATLDALVGSLKIEGMISSGLLATEWEWIADMASGSETQSIEDPSAYTVYFEEDSTFYFKADCNSGGGSYTVDGGFNGTVSMEAGPLTAAACPPESLSDQYISYLVTADAYRLHPGGKSMELSLPGGAGTIVFSEAGTADVDLPEPESGEAIGTVIAEAGANVRLGPSTSYPSIGVAPYGASGTIIGVSQDNQWWAFDVPESQSLMGWVLASLIEAENVADIPIMPAPVLPDPTPVPTPVPPPSPTIKFWSDATVIAEGDCTELHWSVENIQAVWVYPQGANYEEYPVTGSGSQSVCPAQTTTYEMRVQHTDGSVEFRTVTITVQPSNGLANTSWVVSTLYGNQFTLPGSTLTAFFGSNNNFSADAGCNTYNGSYSVSGNSISIGPLAGTQMSCGEALDTQEQAYLSALEAARTFTIDGSQMTLFDGAGQELARLIFTG